jgi:hypothetical protein
VCVARIGARVADDPGSIDVATQPTGLEVTSVPDDTRELDRSLRALAAGNVSGARGSEPPMA